MNSLLSYTTAGVTDILQPAHQKYALALNAAGMAMDELLELCQGGHLEARNGWEKETSRSNCVMYSKSFANGKLFTTRVVYNFPMEQLFGEYWRNLEVLPSFNENLNVVRKLVTLSPLSDIIYYALNDNIGVAKSEFLFGRMYRKIGNEIFVAARSFDDENVQPKNDEYTRADLMLGAARFRTEPGDLFKTVIDHMYCVDFKEAAETLMVNNEAIVKYMLDEIEYTSKRISLMKIGLRRFEETEEHYIF